MEMNTITGFRLSLQQEQMWTEGVGACNAVLMAQLEEPCSFAEIESALHKIILRHEILRTVYRRQAGMKVPFQVILDKLDPVWETVELGERTEIDKLFEREMQRE